MTSAYTLSEKSEIRHEFFETRIARRKVKNIFYINACKSAKIFLVSTTCKMNNPHMIKNKNYIIKITKKLKNINDISLLIYLKCKKLL